jgi:hypothetical protein
VKEAFITANREVENENGEIGASLGLDVGRRTRCRGCVVGSACSAWCCEVGVNFPHSPLRKAPGIARTVGIYFLAMFIEYCKTSLLSFKFAARLRWRKRIWCNGDGLRGPAGLSFVAGHRFHFVRGRKR